MKTVRTRRYQGIPSASEDLVNRRPVWEVLSQLFLDTELMREDIENIARTVSNSPYDISQLQYILYRELYPVLISNLRMIAGAWGGFDQQMLEQQILARDRRTLRLPLLFQIGRWRIRSEWSQVMAHVKKIRTPSLAK